MKKLIITPNMSQKELKEIWNESFEREFLYGESIIYIQEGSNFNISEGSYNTIKIMDNFYNHLSKEQRKELLNSSL